VIKLFIGIDVGVNGAVAVLDSYGECVAYQTLPHRQHGKRKELDGEALASWITSEVMMPTGTKPHECAVVVEESPPFNQGVVSAYTSGYNNGRLHERLLQLFNRRPLRITARKWQGVVYDFKLKREDDKKAISIAQAKERHGDMAGAFNVKRYADGISDALHIAEYCRLLETERLEPAKMP
tara:strand:+ start:10986 stop:11528 length:543 start_codon:yes stop_codon:yes gene_type:complete